MPIEREQKDYHLILISKFYFKLQNWKSKAALDILPHLGFGTRTDVPRWKTTAFNVEKAEKGPKETRPSNCHHLSSYTRREFYNRS